MLPRIKKVQELSNLNAINFTKSRKYNIKLPRLYVNYDQTLKLGDLSIPSQDTSTFQRTFYEEGRINCKQNPMHSEKRPNEIGGGGSARSCPLGQKSSSQFREQTLFHFTDAIFFILSENLPCELVRQRPRVHFVQFQVSYCRELLYFQLSSFEKQKSQFSRATGTYNWTNDFFQ